MSTSSKINTSNKNSASKTSSATSITSAINKSDKSDKSDKWTEARTIRLEDLQINPKYQRPLNEAWVRHIVNNFDEKLVSPLQVSFRNGKYFVFDGQHTLKALALKFNNPDYPVICKVYRGMSEEEEAEMFYLFNTSQKKINTLSIIRAQSFYGDAETRKFLQCTNETGFSINPAKSSTSRYNIRAVKKAHSCFFTLGADEYKRMLKCIMKTWEGAPWSVSQNMLSGMTLLFRVFKLDIIPVQFVKRLKSFNDDDIDREASQFYNLTVKYRYAWALGNLYNKKAGHGSLDLTKLNFVNY